MASVKTIVCAVDFSEGSPRVAEYAATLAKATGASLVCVYIAPSLAEYVGFNVPQAALDSFVGDVVSSAGQTMDAFVAEHFAGLPAKGLVLAGYPAEEILAAAEEQHADLIVMGTHGRTGIDRIIFGSVAEKVVKSARCPVLTVKPREEA
ncbi:MAG: universal stress protein UspA-like protein [Solidesulfovibrio magneticus str. Maddingley MBC34]|jgi:nucleotide-binding universal stress UspA family protein|uniref:Universal stress protein n=1 Tax=Solidesulfovibrio magneticus str. Maddingley MBC34 TaxID=1206767 RepID=K6GAD9_9BACT|nr:MAG: universal stress protein UspA-like protein [Solidesulfovibrio magneticus str. Maddingley MBC34]